MSEFDPEFGKRLQHLRELLQQHGLSMKITEGRRSLARQAELYAQGRQGDRRPRVTNARPGQSPHNWGLAADFVFLDAKGKVTWSGDWAAFGAQVRAAGLTWGGDFRTLKDRPHVELPKWRAHIPKEGGSG